MKRAWLSVVAWCALGVAGQAVAASAAAPTTMPSQVLVMLRVAPPHLRGADGYAANYAATPDEAARRRIALQLAHQYGLQLVDSWLMPALGLDCFVMRIAAGASAGQIAQTLASDARVESAEPMQWFRVLANNDPLYPLQPVATQWHLAELHAVAAGRNIIVAEIDSGVDSVNPDLAGQVIEQRNFVDDGPYLAELHGTEVAGIIVAREGNGVGIAGVAPQAHLLALRACWQVSADDASALCSSFTLAKALQYVLERHVQIINLSLAGPDDRLLQRLLDVALARRITVVGAVDDTAADGGFPAAYSGVLAVADERAGQHVIDVLRAPGEDIPTTQPGARWGFVTGASFAAAEVSGLVALIRELSPGITPVQLQEALHARTELGFALMRPTPIDACAAVAQASRRCTCDCATANASPMVPRR